MPKSKITVTVEVDGFAVTETVKDFIVGGNPRFFAQHVEAGLREASKVIGKTVVTRFGDVRNG